MQRDPALLWDMLRRARRVQRFVEGKTFADYLQDPQLQDAVERCVEVIGEAARNVSRELRDAHPEIPWGASVAQRHILAHDYDEIRPDRIYKVASVHIPELIALLEPLVPDPPEPTEA